MVWHAGVATERKVSEGGVESHPPPTLPFLYTWESETKKTIVEGLRLTSRHRQDPHSRNNKGHGTGVAMGGMAFLHWRIALT